MTNIEPTGHHILIKPDTVEEKTAGGIYIPDQTRDREQGGTIKGAIIKIGPNAWKAFDGGEPWAKVGDRVCYARYAGFEVEDDKGEKFQIMNDEDVKAVL